eukprot:scaffold10219_cov59-Phaeocystis_antarctica.AAC.1
MPQPCVPRLQPCAIQVSAGRRPSAASVPCMWRGGSSSPGIHAPLTLSLTTDPDPNPNPKPDPKPKPKPNPHPHQVHARRALPACRRRAAPGSRTWQRPHIARPLPRQCWAAPWLRRAALRPPDRFAA